MKIIDVALKDLKPYKNNPRFNSKAVPAVKESILKFGFKVPLVIDKNNVIVCGHTRYFASKELGFEKIPCIVADDLNEKQIDAFRLVDNRTAEFADWDLEKLAEELTDLADFDLDAFGFDDLLAGLGDAFLEENKEVVEDDFDVEPPAEPISKRGDFYKLGNHYLLCGSSLEEKDVERLTRGNLMDLVVTDPPYGVYLEDKFDNLGIQSKTREHSKIEGDDLRGDALFDFLEKFYINMKENLKEGGAFYIWYASSNANIFIDSLEKAGLKARQELIWVKQQFVFSRCDYHYKHEPCLYGWKEGKAHYFIDDHTKDTILEFERPKKNKLHPTMKPVPLMAELVKNSSKKGENVIDYFGGSGTTIIACEQLGRNCYMMEYDPAYCDVIVQRWEEFTGRKAEKLE